jgi:hypothetical protein
MESVKVYKSSIQADGGAARSDTIQQFKNQLATQMKNMEKSENAFSSDDLEGAHVYEESDSEYEMDNRKIQQLVKESTRKPFVPGVSDAERVDESAQSALLGTLGYDLPERFEHLEEKMFYRPHDLNPANPEYGFDEEQDTLNEDFVKDTDPAKYDDDQQVCPLVIFLGLPHMPSLHFRKYSCSFPS